MLVIFPTSNLPTDLEVENINLIRTYTNLDAMVDFCFFKPPKSPLSGGLLNALRKSYLILKLA